MSTNRNADKNRNANIGTGMSGIEIKKEINSMTYMRNDHISDSQLESLRLNRIDDAELIELLEHAGQCTFCAERLGEAVEEGMMSIMPPVYLKDQIREQIEKIDVIVDKKVRQTSKQLQLILYSFKVAATVSLAILMLCVTSVFPMNDMTKVEAARMERYQEKIERDEKRIAEEYSNNGFLDEKYSVRDFLKENLGGAIQDLLDKQK